MQNEHTQTTSQESIPPIIAQLDDISRELATRAFNGTSFDPEKRGESRRKEYVEAVNGLYAEMWGIAKTDEQKALLAAEMERYRQGYVKHLSAYLQSHSNVVSSMIAGPARFPVARMQKRGQWADNKVNELLEWDRKARAAVKSKLLDARPQEEKDAAEWDAIRRDINDSLNTIEAIDAGRLPYARPLFASSIAGRIEQLAQAGEVELVKKAVGRLAEYDLSHEKPAFTSRHKVWSFLSLANESAARNEARAGKPQELLGEAEGVELWANYQLDRVQLVFAEKPDHQTREKLSRSGWKWSPRNEAWQRQLTRNGIDSGKAILAGLTPAPQQEGRSI